MLNCTYSSHHDNLERSERPILGGAMGDVGKGQLWGIVLAGGEGRRAREFLQQLCGGRGIKQFCAVIGRRSMLQHTLARAERLIPRERILVVVNSHHREEVTPQLAHWPTENVIFQPVNRETAPGILLPLAHLSHRDPQATVAVFPSDHFILAEDRFMRWVGKAVAETQRFPQALILLGMTPTGAEKGYGWIEPAVSEEGGESLAVQRFWEKPSIMRAQALLTRGALWNTFVFAVHAPTLWRMVQRTTPDLYKTFAEVRQLLGTSLATAENFTKQVYKNMPTINFSLAVCESLVSWLRVLPVPEVGWSDWGSVERICTSLEQLGKLDQVVARLQPSNSQKKTALEREQRETSRSFLHRGSFRLHEAG